jgi:DNA-binding transcriptional MerR regulator
VKTLYSATAAARLLNLNPARLQRWLNYGHFKPEHRAMLGDTEARLLTEQEIQRLQVAVDLINTGVPIQEAFDRIGDNNSEKIQQDHEAC